MTASCATGFEELSYSSALVATHEGLAAALADRYRLERDLGQGGMAIVFLAEDRKHHREVAVKVLRAELAGMLGPDARLRARMACRWCEPAWQQAGHQLGRL